MIKFLLYFHRVTFNWLYHLAGDYENLAHSLRTSSDWLVFCLANAESWDFALINLWEPKAVSWSGLLSLPPFSVFRHSTQSATVLQIEMCSGTKQHSAQLSLQGSCGQFSSSNQNSRVTAARPTVLLPLPRFPCAVSSPFHSSALHKAFLFSKKPNPFARYRRHWGKKTRRWKDLQRPVVISNKWNKWHLETAWTSVIPLRKFTSNVFKSNLETNCQIWTECWQTFADCWGPKLHLWGISLHQYFHCRSFNYFEQTDGSPWTRFGQFWPNPWFGSVVRIAAAWVKDAHRDFRMLCP